MSVPFPWTCPYCNRDATITEPNFSSKDHFFDNNNKDGQLCIRTTVTVCPNKACKEYAISAFLSSAYTTRSGAWDVQGKPLLYWNLKPRSQARVFPSYIPRAILDDYQEACLIRDLSPKASATLSRRCLQGIIRDFHKIKKKRLVDEIEALNEKIDPLTWQAIDAVRHVGNIGAHMGKDINLVIDVDPQEAAALIGLIEMLLKDWYIARHDKEKQLEEIVNISKAKKEIKDSKSIPEKE